MNFQRAKFLFLGMLLAASLALGWFFYARQPKTQLESTLAPAFQLMGKAPAAGNRALTSLVPVDGLDEKNYGQAIALRYEPLADKNNLEYQYLNAIMGEMQKFAQKPFSYRVFVLPYAAPNACALPGGVILVTKGLLHTLKSEAELVSVLAHEMGHIELSHCFEIVRFQLLTKKLGSRSLGEVADFAVNNLLRHSYSKTHENEADEYAFTLVTNTPYDPSAVGDAFQSLLNLGKRPRRPEEGPGPPHADPIQEYFMTHPYLELRQEKFSERGRVWWLKNTSQRKYIGRINLQQRVTLKNMQFPQEWKESPAEPRG